eukprot:5396098-Pleurochrysis_carterae.AAC.4
MPNAARMRFAIQGFDQAPRNGDAALIELLLARRRPNVHGRIIALKFALKVGGLHVKLAHVTASQATDGTQQLKRSGSRCRRKRFQHRRRVRVLRLVLLLITTGNRAGLVLQHLTLLVVLFA